MEEYFYTTLEETGKYIIRQNGVSFSRLQNDFGFNFFDIYDILSKLEKYHVLGTETSYGTRDVLMTVREFEIVAERCFTHDEKNTKYRITSPLTTNTIKQSIPATTEQSIANQEEINFNDVIVSFFNTLKMPFSTSTSMVFNSLSSNASIVFSILFHLPTSPFSSTE